jgi:hypothetical protein
MYAGLDNSPREALHLAIDDAVGAASGAKRKLWHQRPSAFKGTKVKLTWADIVHMAVHVVSKRQPREEGSLALRVSAY